MLRSLSMPNMKKLEKEPKVPVTVMLPWSTKLQLDQHMLMTKRSRGSYIELALSHEFQKDLNEQQP